MQEDFLHYIWLHKKFKALNLRTTDDEPLTLVSPGQPNRDSGPDFFNARLRINEQLWAGNVEIHIRSSDWYAHHHETDPAYDNVILHVVWEHDIDVYRQDNSIMPTLELNALVPEAILNQYNHLFAVHGRWINCERDLETVDDFTIDNWLERLYFERLERKSIEIEVLLRATSNDWEAVLFQMMAKNFGFKVNGSAFLSMANSFDFSVVQKLRSNCRSLEALFFGQSGLLQTAVEAAYISDLRSEYNFLKQKFGLSGKHVERVQFFRLRPSNFPTIRLSQLANLYAKQETLFALLMETNRLEDFYTLLTIPASGYWDRHYTFGKLSRARKKTISKEVIDLLIINTIVPLRFCYLKHKGVLSDREITALIGQVASEKNSVVDTFNSLKPISRSAMQSQALLQLKSEYCDQNKCLRCAIGNSLLSQL